MLICLSVSPGAFHFHGQENFPTFSLRTTSVLTISKSLCTYSFHQPLGFLASDFVVYSTEAYVWHLVVSLTGGGL